MPDPYLFKLVLSPTTRGHKSPCLEFVRCDSSTALPRTLLSHTYLALPIHSPTSPSSNTPSLHIAPDAMDKVKAIFRRFKDKGTSGTKTEAPAAAAVPKPTPTETAPAPSTSDPATAPAGQ